MRIAALYDIHGNLPALEAAIDDARAAGAEHLVIGGDVIPGPMPVDCLDLLASIDLPSTCIVGNGEIAVLAERDGRDCGVPPQYRRAIQWVAAQLPPAHVRRIATWPRTARIDDVFFCHATPRNENEIVLRTTPAEVLARIFAAPGRSLVVCGHTHMQFDRRLEDVRIVNAGSVGMPFGAPGAHWLWLAPEPELRRSAYALDAAAERLRAAAYPAIDEFVARYVLARPSEEEMLAAYAKAEVQD